MEEKGIGRRKTQLLVDLRNKRRYLELKEEAEDRNRWKRQFISRTQLLVLIPICFKSILISSSHLHLELPIIIIIIIIIISKDWLVSVFHCSSSVSYFLSFVVFNRSPPIMSVYVYVIHRNFLCYRILASNDNGGLKIGV